MGARERARGALADHLRDVGDAERHLARDARASGATRVTGAGATAFFDWVKDRSHLFRGVTYGTIVRGEAFNFSRLGTFLERADNTARILDVKYHILLPSVEDVGGALDYYQWTALLRSVSSFETYRTLYRDQIFPIKVAQLLILERRMPRSLAACFDQVKRGDRPHRAARTTRRRSGLAYELHARLTLRRHGGGLPGRAARVPDRSASTTSASSATASSEPTWGRYEILDHPRIQLCVRLAGARSRRNTCASRRATRHARRSSIGSSTLPGSCAA